MILSKPVKILLGIGTAWLTVFPAFFVAAWMLMSIGMMAIPFLLRDRFSPAALLLLIIPFVLIFVLEFATIALQMFMLVFYLIHIIKNTVAPESLRIIFGVGNFFMPFISMPIYYYLFIWLDRPPDWALNPVPPPADNRQTAARQAAAAIGEV
jgi:hypothetical protein